MNISLYGDLCRAERNLLTSNPCSSSVKKNTLKYA
uniref:Uncharacterized protein n=1 Tax=Dulem virus 39 TaxID=3145757 RepID=A0AAU8B5A4_9CAUD